MIYNNLECFIMIDNALYMMIYNDCWTPKNNINNTYPKWGYVSSQLQSKASSFVMKLILHFIVADMSNSMNGAINILAATGHHIVVPPTFRTFHKLHDAGIGT